MRVERRAKRRVLRIGLDLLQRRVGDQPVLDARVRDVDELMDAGHFLVRRARGDEAEHPRHFHFVFVVWVARSGRADTVKEAGAGSVSHIASMAAIFIFWFSPAL